MCSKWGSTAIGIWTSASAICDMPPFSTIHKTQFPKGLGAPWNSTIPQNFYSLVKDHPDPDQVEVTDIWSPWYLVVVLGWFRSRLTHWFQSWPPRFPIAFTVTKPPGSWRLSWVSWVGWDVHLTTSIPTNMNRFGSELWSDIAWISLTVYVPVI